MSAPAYDPEVARHSVLAYAVEVDSKGIGKYSARTIGFLTGTNESFVRKVLAAETDLKLPASRRAADGSRVYPAHYAKGKIQELAAKVVDLRSMHPALKLMPELSEDEYKKLREDIEINGACKPILVDRDGRLLDGRARLRACTELELPRPTTKVVREKPWDACLIANVPRLTKAQAIAVMAKMPPGRRRAGGGDLQLPPPILPICEALEVSRTKVGDVQRGITLGATEELLKLCEDGLVRPYTLTRVAAWTPEEQAEYVDRVRGGEGQQVALRPRRHVAQRDNRSPNRHNLVTSPVIETQIHQLEALCLVLDGAGDGLDPGINSDEAGILLARLAKAHRAYGRLNQLLKKRKESSS